MIAIGKDTVEDLFQLSPELSVATRRVHVGSYDFDFRKYFEVRSVFGQTNAQLILRIGAIHNYEQVYTYFAEMGLQVVNSIEEHNNVSLLPNWYPKIRDFTPRSMVFEQIPTYEVVKSHFEFPVFVKGERQTNKHQKALCIAENRSDFEKIAMSWATDPILNWQKMIVREFVDLMPIEAETEHEIKKSFEVRVFVWYGKVVSWGQYWDSNHKIQMDKADEDKISALTQLVYRELPVPFMVIDFAKKSNNEWIVIELNDAQESGYAMNPKVKLWSNIVG